MADRPPPRQRAHRLALCDELADVVRRGVKTQTRRVVSATNSLIDGGCPWYQAEWGYYLVMDRACVGVEGEATQHLAVPSVRRGSGYSITSIVSVGHRICFPGATVVVTSVRVERLQDISDEDVQAEGFEDRAAFFALWDRLHNRRERRSAANPWVWVYEWNAPSLNVLEPGAGGCITG